MNEHVGRVSTAGGDCNDILKKAFRQLGCFSHMGSCNDELELQQTKQVAELRLASDIVLKKNDTRNGGNKMGMVLVKLNIALG